MTCFIVYYKHLYYSGYVNDRVFMDEIEAQNYVTDKQSTATDKIWDYETSILGGAKIGESTREKSKTHDCVYEKSNSSTNFKTVTGNRRSK